MAARFRRLTRGFIKDRRNRVSSLDNMLEEEKPASAAINRFPSADHLHFTSKNNSDDFIRKRAWTDPTEMCNKDNKLTRDWMRDWQVPLVFPFGHVEFQCRVEAVKSAVMTDMDAEQAQDMSSYNLARRRRAVCKDMIALGIEKAICTLGILGS